jgi:hypothetical protein
VTADPELLAAMAAAFTPDRAERLLGRVAAPAGPLCARRGAELSRASRPERLAALASAIRRAAPPDPQGHAPLRRLFSLAASRARHR